MWIYSLLFSSLLLLSPLHAEEYKQIPERSKLPVLSPNKEGQKTEKLQLKNGVQVFLISNPEAQLSGAMLSVNVGSWEDPAESPGLAHFLEHMLFLGTLKYPKESEYGAFITQNGGQSNAFTASDSTNYLFTVNTQAFPEALSRFSSFFREPLFNASGVNRELQAIDQEYAKNLKNDSMRQMYVLKELADPKHPYHQFNMGNSDTLKAVSRDEMEQWFRLHYSGNLMRLVVYSSLPIEKLRDLTVKEFSEIHNTDAARHTATFPAFEKGYNTPPLVFIEPVKETRSLTLAWELPTEFSHLKETQPEYIAGYILGHEGEQSLLSKLKKEGFAEELSAGGVKLGNDLMLFYLQVELTKSGVLDYDQVLQRCFEAIALLKNTPVPEHVFDEIQRIATIKYQYPSDDEPFEMLMKHAYQIQDEALETYPEHTLVIQRFDPDAVQRLAQNLTPQNGYYLLVAPQKITRVASDRKEKWLGVPYAVNNIDRKTVEEWSHIGPQAFAFPEPNPFIPETLQLTHSPFVKSSRAIPNPETLFNDERSTIYYALDETFGIPKVSWTIRLKSPALSIETAEHAAFGDLYVKELKERLNTTGYLAKIAGLEYEIERKKQALTITLSGYSENSKKLLEYILKTIQTYKPSEHAFKLHKDSLVTKYQNFTQEQPVEQSIELFKSLLYRDFSTNKEKAVALRKATFEDYQGYNTSLFSQIYIEGMLYGNLTKQEALDVGNLLNNTFPEEPYLRSEQFKTAVLRLPKETGPYFLEARTQAQGNAVLLAVQSDSFSFKERAAQQISMQAIQQPFFHSLRTQQQTGYLVHSFSEEIERQLFNIFAVQSNTHDVRDLLSRFELFIEGYLKELSHDTFTKQEFDAIKRAMLDKYEVPAKNIKKMGELLASLAFEYDGDFQWIEKRLQAFRSLTYEEVLALTHKFLGRENKRRLALLMHGVIPEKHLFSYERARTWNMIRKMSEYQERDTISERY